MKLYTDLVDWYHLIDPLADHEDEAQIFCDLLAERGISRGTLLELGCGAGNNAWWLREPFQLTLTDLSPQMLALSRARNPDARHVEGDMRTLRLDQHFDVVLVHDAVCYLTTEADLRAMAQTVAAHLRPGGVALISPDTTRECFFEWRDENHAGGGDRALYFTEWSWDPDPEDNAYAVEFVFQCRENGAVRVVHDHHEEGLFSTSTWVEVLRSAGLEVEAVEARTDEVAGTPYTPLIFVARRPTNAG